MPKVPTPDDALLTRLLKSMHHREKDPLRPVIDEYYLKRGRATNRYSSHVVNLAERPRPGGRFSPSSLCGCERQAAFKFLGVKGRKKLDPDLEAKFDDGNWRHHKWDAIFYDMEAVLGKKVFKVLSIEEDVAIPELHIAGSLDAAVRIYGEKVVVDFKGINDRGYYFVNSRDQPIASHVLQLITYCKARKIYKGIIFYDNKNDQLTRSFVISFTPDEFEQVEQWCNRVIEKMNRKRLPDMASGCEGGTFQYNRCPFARLCYGSLSDKELRKLVYKNFDSVEASWEEGNRKARSN